MNPTDPVSNWSTTAPEIVTTAPSKQSFMEYPELVHLPQQTYDDTESNWDGGTLRQASTSNTERSL